MVPGWSGVTVNGVNLHYIVAGEGPVVLAMHGWPQNHREFLPVIGKFAGRYRFIVPDLRGLGRSSKPPSGFDKKTQASDVAGVLTALRIAAIDLVTHDIGNMVGFAFAAQHPERVKRLVLIDAPLPGVGPWEEILRHPLLWHFRFGGPDMERRPLVVRKVRARRGCGISARVCPAPRRCRRCPCYRFR